jgi:hypothetical protein
LSLIPPRPSGSPFHETHSIVSGVGRIDVDLVVGL